MTQFTSVENFVGLYTGVYDGRLAGLQIDRDGTSLRLTYTEVERGETFVGVQHVPDQSVHTLTGISLINTKDANRVLWWPMLNIHTWNIDYLSGLSYYFPQAAARNSLDWILEYGYQWNMLYGISFTRRIPATPGVGP
jgi:hypothetical protein